jgi:BirA family transcriptional regulator, biotin operon repressor / biotin---[acetyl-CoA-carboxylase] ligase
MFDLSAEAITATLTTRRLGRPTLYFPIIGSTNDVAHAEAAVGAGDGLLVIADEQTAGRGRLDRRWWAPRGSSLLMSLLLRPALPPSQAGQLTMCLGLGAVEGIEAVTGLRPALKWPNDLLLDGRKLGGMLTELRLDGEHLAYAVLGIGINVNVDFDDGRSTTDGGQHPLPPAAVASAVWSIVNGPLSGLADTAISLSMSLGHDVDRVALLVAILERCEAWYERVLAGQSPHAAWAARLDTVGHRVAVTTTAGSLVGMAIGVTPEGALLVRNDDAAEHVIWSGDVTALRRAG